MITKTFEIRDAGTFIPVLAIRLKPDCEADRYLLARSGYGRTSEDQEGYILVVQMYGEHCKGRSDPYEWDGSRTMVQAHDYINKHFDTLLSGAVIDVEFIRGIRSHPKKSESLSVDF